MSCTCEMPEGIIIKPDGVHELDPCKYELSEVYTNVTVEILRCKKCGKFSIGWYKTKDTHKLTNEELKNWEGRG